MTLRFTVLASGSSGNASLLEMDGFGVLVDIGLGPRQLAARLAHVGAAWQRVQAVVLTHTHGDHWRERTLAWLARHRIGLCCHAAHAAQLTASSDAFAGLRAAGLVQLYEAHRELVLTPGLRCRPLPVSHDSGPTFGFRFECTKDLFHPPLALAYAADLGCWTDELADALADVDLLALEFNHDVALEYASGRSPHLIARVLGDHGHLSNDQAAQLLRRVLHRSEPGRLRQVIQLHLSCECNRPTLALGAARRVVQEVGQEIDIRTASQDEPVPTLHVGGGRVMPRRGRPSRGTGSRRVSAEQRWLPGFEDSPLKPGHGQTA